MFCFVDFFHVTCFDFGHVLSFGFPCFGFFSFGALFFARPGTNTGGGRPETIDARGVKDWSGQVTFGLTADGKEAHSQVPIHLNGWHLLGCQHELGGETYVNTVRTFRVPSAS